MFTFPVNAFAGFGSGFDENTCTKSCTVVPTGTTVTGLCTRHGSSSPPAKAAAATTPSPARSPRCSRRVTTRAVPDLALPGERALVAQLMTRQREVRLRRCVPTERSAPDPRADREVRPHDVHDAHRHRALRRAEVRARSVPAPAPPTHDGDAFGFVPAAGVWIEDPTHRAEDVPGALCPARSLRDVDERIRRLVVAEVVLVLEPVRTDHRIADRHGRRAVLLRTRARQPRAEAPTTPIVSSRYQGGTRYRNKCEVPPPILQSSHSPHLSRVLAGGTRSLFRNRKRPHTRRKALLSGAPENDRAGLNATRDGDEWRCNLRRVQ